MKAHLNIKPTTKGYSWCRKIKKYRARVTFRTVLYNLGNFENEEDAANAAAAFREFLDDCGMRYYENNAKIEKALRRYVEALDGGSVERKGSKSKPVPAIR